MPDLYQSTIILFCDTLAGELRNLAPIKQVHVRQRHSDIELVHYDACQAWVNMQG